MDLLLFLKVGLAFSDSYYNFYKEQEFEHVCAINHH